MHYALCTMHTALCRWDMRWLIKRTPPWSQSFQLHSGWPLSSESSIFELLLNNVFLLPFNDVKNIRGSQSWFCPAGRSGTYPTQPTCQSLLLASPMKWPSKRGKKGMFMEIFWPFSLGALIPWAPLQFTSPEAFSSGLRQRRLLPSISLERSFPPSMSFPPTSLCTSTMAVLSWVTVSGRLAWRWSDHKNLNVTGRWCRRLSCPAWWPADLELPFQRI